MSARVFTLACIALLATSAAAAQTPGMAGTYLVDFDMRVQLTEDGPQVAERGKARLTLEVRGDSVFGTWQVLASETPARTLRGTAQGGTITLAGEPGQARVNLNGEVQTVQVTSTFNVTVTGDEVRGTIESSSPLPGMPGLTRRFEGKRQS